MAELIDVLQATHVPDSSRKVIYRRMIDEFEHHDCASLRECLGHDPMYDEAFRYFYPEEES